MTHILRIASLVLLIAVLGLRHEALGQPIDRKALVSRHKIRLTQSDSLSSLTVGNGEFAFTADVSGLQSFPEYYENGVSLGTQSQWGWHRFPNDGNYQLEEVLQEYESCNNQRIPIAIQHRDGRKAEAANYLRANPHRLHLGLVGLALYKANGQEAAITDLENLRQELDLWTGGLTTSYFIEGVPVRVTLYGHQQKDGIAFRITSPLIAQGRLKIRLRFPYGKDCHVCPGYDWEHPEKHQSQMVALSPKTALVMRTLDQDKYAVGLQWAGRGTWRQAQPHTFEFTPGNKTTHVECGVWFSPTPHTRPLPGFAATQRSSIQGWKAFWSTGGAIDFSGGADPRAFELERRVVLSQYLTKVQCAGSLPPQETGLTFNSWYGKFHLEMHWWHGVHFALWNRIGLLEKSMPWYAAVMEEARKTAQRQGYEGVRWQKMTGPEGRSSPSSVGEFLAWQQPHPVYFAELLYRQRPTAETLNQYKDLVFETARFMASYAQFSEADQRYHLCHPLIPAQEIFPATETDDPPFELAYWKFALQVAQTWRTRLGMAPDPKWQDVIDRIAPLPAFGGLYLPAARATEAYTRMENREDHPVVTGAYGMLPDVGMADPAKMKATFQEIMRDWNWKTTWGWDYPMLAMCAARLGLPEEAVNALLLDVQKNTYLVNGHNYQDKRLRIYLPGNGGLLTAVAMMAAGWENGPEAAAPGFPKDWKVRYEGLKKML